MNNMEGNLNESYYLCEGVWFDKTKKPYELIDRKDKNTLLNISSTDTKILIFERETYSGLFDSIELLLDNDKKNKSNYQPFKHSIYALYGIFSYIEKVQRYIDGKPYKSKDTDATKILTFGFKRIFRRSDQEIFGNDKIEKILERTRHSMMHFANIGDDILLNNDYEIDYPIKYIGGGINLWIKLN